MTADLGPLPPTWRLTARGPGCLAARFLYAIPAGLIVNNKPFIAYGGQVDAVRTGWRLSWAPGDIHPGTGQHVVCYGPDGKPCDLPHVSAVPPYPDTWLAYFRDVRPQRSLPARNSRAQSAVVSHVSAGRRLGGRVKFMSQTLPTAPPRIAVTPGPGFPNHLRMLVKPASY